MWIHHDTFMDLVKDVWGVSIAGSTSFVLCHKLKLLRTKLRKWNQEVFWDLNSKIQAASQCVLDIQNQLSLFGLSDDLLNQEIVAASNLDFKKYAFSSTGNYAKRTKQNKMVEGRG